MKISKWIEIEQELTQRIGWKTTISIMIDAHRQLYPDKQIYELTTHEEKQLTNKIKSTYQRITAHENKD